MLWEACQTLNGSWGYDRDNLDWKSVDLLVRMLVDTVSKGGNLLLNVGPDGARRVRPAAAGDAARHRRRGCAARPGDPRLPARATSRRRRTAATPRTATGSTCTCSPGRSRRCTCRAGRPGRYAQLLHDASAIPFRCLGPRQEAFATAPPGQPPGTLTLELPVRQPEVEIPVVKFFFTSSSPLSASSRSSHPHVRLDGTRDPGLVIRARRRGRVRLGAGRPPLRLLGEHGAHEGVERRLPGSCPR